MRGAGRGRTGGLSNHLLAPDAGPAHGGPATLRATSGPQVPSAGRSRGRTGRTRPPSFTGWPVGEVAAWPAAHQLSRLQEGSPQPQMPAFCWAMGSRALQECIPAASPTAPPQMGPHGRGQRQLPRAPSRGLRALSAAPPAPGQRAETCWRPHPPGQARTGDHEAGLPPPHCHRQDPAAPSTGYPRHGSQGPEPTAPSMGGEAGAGGGPCPEAGEPTGTARGRDRGLPAPLAGYRG